MNKFIALVVVYVTLTQGAFSEGRLHSIMIEEQAERPVTGNLRVDFFGQTELADVPRISPQEESPVHARKSPFIAAGLSLAVPGAGQFYTERYWEAVAFFAADVAAWVLAYHYDRKGDKQTDLFQTYADARWSAVRYAEFTEQTYLGTHLHAWLKPNTEGLPPWQRVDWNVLNEMERQVARTPDGQYYSHTLPPYGDQQYYELIGKYQEFYQGWDDADPALTTYVQISHRLQTSPTNMIYYSGERGKANDYYRTASTWVTVAIINHVVNAAYAGLSAGWYNSAHAELGLQSVPTERGYTNVPVVKMRWEF
jgi:hypothetical protein